jgi:transcription elongation factor Elf1
VDLETLKCRNCGAALDKSAVKVVAGAVMVTCPYCGTSYQIEEKPMW